MCCVCTAGMIRPLIYHRIGLNELNMSALVWLARNTPKDYSNISIQRRLT